MMRNLFLDIETRSPLPLQKVGIWAYAEDVKIILCAYALEDEEVKLWDCVKNPHMPIDLWSYCEDPNVMCVAHNSLFERLIIGKFLGLCIPPKRWICTSVLSRINGLPASLKNACKALKFPEHLTKMEEGTALISRFSIGDTNESPYNETRKNHKQAWDLFGQYCKKDVEATRELFKRLSPLSSEERELWLLDQEINDRGYQIDWNLVKKLQELIVFERVRLDEELKELTLGVIESSRKTDVLNKYLFIMTGCDLPDMRADTIKATLAQSQLSPFAKEILTNRLEASQSSVLKINTLADAVCPDNRLRGTLQFYGASRTGRWSGCVFQPQNLPRQLMSYEKIEKHIDDLLHNKFQIDNPLQFASDCVRSCIIASSHKKLVVADLSGIEARVLAWMAGEHWKIDAFAQGEDIYKTTYAKTFNIPVCEVTKDQRAIGKVMELALGYQGGARVFQTMASNLGLDLQQLSSNIQQTSSIDDWEQAQRRCLWMQETHPKFAVHDSFVGTACELVKTAWRNKHKGIVQLWKDCEEAFDYTFKSGNTISARRTANVPSLLMGKHQQNLFIVLPSKRRLIYRDVESDRSYLNTAPSQFFERERTYGGKLTENIVQAVSRDILAYGMMNVTKAGYDIVLTVHDEIVCETPDTPQFNAQSLCELMAQNPPWAKGLPLKAQGYEAGRYRK